MSNKSKLIYIIKLSVGLGLLAFLLLKDNNLIKVIDRFSKIDFLVLTLLIANGLIMNLVSCLKWSLFLKERTKTVIKIRRLFSLYMIGKFFNNFIPSMIGGDITRSLLLGKEIESHSKSAASVFLERFTGLIAMLTLGIIFSIVNYKILSEPLILISVIIIGLLTVAIALTIYNNKIYQLLSKPFRNIKLLNKIFNKVDLLLEDIAYFKNKSQIIVKSMLYSFLFHIQTSIAVYLSCLAIGLSPAFLDVAVVTPIILLVVTIPVSPNNIGWWEWTFSVLLTHTGASSADGFTVALILRGITFLFSAWGGLLFMYDKIFINPKVSVNS